MRRREWPTLDWAVVSLLAVLTACGSGGSDDGSTTPELATVSTLAYVVNECRLDGEGGTLRQRLQIRRGEQDPVTVVDTSAVRFTGRLSLCGVAGVSRGAFLFSGLGAFQRLGVTPDGAQVVFEMTDDLPPTLFPPNTLRPEQEGIFAVRADGTGLRRLAAASRESTFGRFDVRPFYVFSPNGRLIAFTGRGPSRDGEDAVQIFTLDLVTGDPRQVTQLPPTVREGTYGPFFNDDETVSFFTHANPEDLNPNGEAASLTINTDGTGLRRALPPLRAIPGSEVLASFRITGAETNTAVLIVPGIPVNSGLGSNIEEVFVIDAEDNVLQLTNFHRTDTFSATLTADGQRVLFSASANPPELGTNPTENCQIFSIDRNGGDLQQLTRFSEGPRSLIGCYAGQPPFGCTSFLTSRDLLTDALIFESTCNPFGTNPYGSELFAMHADGTGLRQLTHLQGYTPGAGGTVIEVIFPFAYPGLNPQYNPGVGP